MSELFGKTINNVAEAKITLYEVNYHPCNGWLCLTRMGETKEARKC
ncbi:MAG: hypothetical protein GQ554_06290 [Deltaproteobacteria bacterium]|nr:hypothetical protein [Deltaproteobacteria bacterium]NOQ86470.1 hypothetical protein [Deltaproteobacteria bacterium]